MIKILKANSKNFEKDLNSILNLRKDNSESKLKVVRKIIKEVKNKGDFSLIGYEKKFNNIKNLNTKKILFSNSEINKNIKKLDIKVKKSIDIAFDRILRFHKKQKFKNFTVKDQYKNVFLYRSRPIEKIGVYVPGGRASYPSSVLMNCIPAIIAGVKDIFVTVPSLNNKINPGVLYASKKCGV